LVVAGTTRRRFDPEFRAGAVRIVKDAGKPVAIRTGGSGVTGLFANGQGSEQLAIDDATGNISRQRYLPYGGRDDVTRPASLRKGLLLTR
jgi:hypothetical protein